VALTRKEACARFELPADRIGDVVVISTQAQGARHQPRQARSVRPDRTAALAWRADRAARAADRQPQDRQLPAGHALRNFDAFDVALNAFSDAGDRP
jgi:phosphonoacetate hydrolase